MTAPSPETETIDIEMALNERWVVHHVLVARAEQAFDDGDAPPTWVRELVDRIETDQETMTLEDARRLHDALETYLARSDTPPRDVEPAVSVADQLAEPLSAH